MRGFGGFAEYVRVPADRPGAQAGRALLRAGGGRAPGRLHGPAGPARPRPDRTRAAGARRRRLRRRRHVRRADRQGARCARDRRLQHRRSRSGPLARRRRGARLHARGRVRALRPRAAGRRDAVTPRVAACAHPEGRARGDQRRLTRSLARRGRSRGEGARPGPVRVAAHRELRGEAERAGPRVPRRSARGGQAASRSSTARTRSTTYRRRWATSRRATPAARSSSRYEDPLLKGLALRTAGPPG